MKIPNPFKRGKRFSAMTLEEQAKVFGIDTVSMSRDRVQIVVNAAVKMTEIIVAWREYLANAKNFQTTVLEIVYKGQAEAYIVTVQREHGKSPAELLAEQRAELLGLRAELAETRRVLTITRDALELASAGIAK